MGVGYDEAIPWILEINRHMRRPDVVFYLRVDPTDAQRRRVARSERPEIYDDLELQKLLAEAYDRIGEVYPEVPLITLDGSRPVAEIADAAWAAVERIRAQGAPI